MPPTTGTKIKIDGVERTLRFRARAWETFEKETGRSVLSGEALKDLGLPEIITLAWVGLQHEDPALTREALADMLTMRDLMVLPATILAAIEADMPAPKTNGASPADGEKKRTRKSRST